MTRLEFTVPPEADGKLLGDVLRKFAGMSRSGVVRAKYTDNGIMLDGVRSRTNMPVRTGQHLSIHLDDAVEKIEACTVVADADADAPDAAWRSLDILYEDESLVVVNKPAGLSMYPGPGHWDNTLGNMMQARTRALGLQSTLHPIHRLDIGTSGAVLFAYNAHAQHRLTEGMHGQGFTRQYLAFCEGVPSADDVPALLDAVLTCENGCFTVEANIARVSYAPSVFAAVPADHEAGKYARTHFRVEESFTLQTPQGETTVSRLRLTLDTGRTHQIRIHMALLGHPLLGDDAYGTGAFTYVGEGGEERALTRPALHSAAVDLVHPLTGEALHLEAPLPEDLAALEPGRE